jgi:hypothetical protein
MRRAPDRPQSTRPPLQPNTPVSGADVDRAADQLLREGQRPTIEKVRAKIGRGSPNTINPLLDQWWQRLAGRLDAGPAALHRLPEPVLLAAEGLWLQSLDEARKRAAAEQGSKKTSLARDAQELEIRAHVLSIRERDIIDRLKQSEGRVARLEIEIEALTTLLRKEQASRLAAERRLAESQSDVPRAHTRRRGRSAAGRAPAKRKANSRTPVKKTRRTSAPQKRTVAVKRRSKR